MIKHAVSDYYSDITLCERSISMQNKKECIDNKNVNCVSCLIVIEHKKLKYSKLFDSWVKNENT